MADFGKATFSVKVDTGPLVEMVQRAIDSIELLDRAVVIWRWEDAPEEYRELLTSTDWEFLALVSPSWRDTPWDSPLSFVSTNQDFIIYEIAGGDAVMAFNS